MLIEASSIPKFRDLSQPGDDVIALVPQRLIAMPQVVLAPHIGSATRETRQAMVDLALGNLKAQFAGQPLLTVGVINRKMPFMPNGAEVGPEFFDLVVTDRTMPRMTGEALADAIHRLRPDIPIVITSGQGSPAGDEEREGEGAQAGQWHEHRGDSPGYRGKTHHRAELQGDP